MNATTKRQKAEGRRQKAVLKDIYLSRDLPVYGGALFLVFADDLNAARKRLAPAFGECKETIPAAAAGFSIKDLTHRQPYYGMCFNSGMLNIPTVAHECFHVAHNILEAVGVPFAAHNHEPFAYLLSFLVDWVVVEAGKHKIDMSGHRHSHVSTTIK